MMHYMSGHNPARDAFFVHLRASEGVLPPLVAARTFHHFNTQVLNNGRRDWATLDAELTSTIERATR